MLNIALPTLDRFDPSVLGYVDAARRENPKKFWLGSDAIWEDYSIGHFAEYAGVDDCPLSRAQFFRHLKLAGVKRTRSTVKDASGKRPYIYKLIARGRPSKRPGRSRDTRLISVPA